MKSIEMRAVRWLWSAAGRGVVVVVVGAMITGGLGGCYQRVVRADDSAIKSGEKIYEPNLKDDERIPLVDDLEDAVMGPDEKR